MRREAAGDAGLSPQALVKGLQEVVGTATVDIGPGDLDAVQFTYSSQSCLAILFDYGRSHGSIGVREAHQIVNAVGRARNAGAALAFIMDTSGIRVTDGIAGIASLRMILREVLDARLEGRSMLAICMNRTFGGASVLASICARRLIDEDCLFAMSGPKLIAMSANAGIPDRDVTSRSIAGRARTSCSGEFELVRSTPDAFRERLLAWLSDPAPNVLTLEQLYDIGRSLGGRTVSKLSRETDGSPHDGIGTIADEVLQVRLGGGYERDRSYGIPVVRSRARGGSCGFVVEALHGVGAGQALALAQALTDVLRKEDPKHCLVVLDADGHSSRASDERLVLSEYLAHVALVVRALHRRGTRVELVVANRGGGGIQAALGAGATSVTMTAGARLFVLPVFAMEALNKAAFAIPGSPEVAIRVGAVDGVFAPEGRRDGVN